MTKNNIKVNKNIDNNNINFEYIKEQIRIVDRLELRNEKKEGNWFVFDCPYCSSKDNMKADKNSHVAVCFSCKAKETVLDYEARHRGKNIRDTALELQDEYFLKDKQEKTITSRKKNNCEENKKLGLNPATYKIPFKLANPKDKHIDTWLKTRHFKGYTDKAKKIIKDKDLLKYNEYQGRECFVIPVLNVENNDLIGLQRFTIDKTSLFDTKPINKAVISGGSIKGYYYIDMGSDEIVIVESFSNALALAVINISSICIYSITNLDLVEALTKKEEFKNKELVLWLDEGTKEKELQKEYCYKNNIRSAIMPDNLLSDVSSSLKRARKGIDINDILTTFDTEAYQKTIYDVLDNALKVKSFIPTRKENIPPLASDHETQENEYDLKRGKKHKSTKEQIANAVKESFPSMLLPCVSSFDVVKSFDLVHGIKHIQTSELDNTKHEPIYDLSQAFNGEKRITLCKASTGTGKTYTVVTEALKVIKAFSNKNSQLSKKNNKLIIIVPTKPMCDMYFNRIHKRLTNEANINLVGLVYQGCAKKIEASDYKDYPIVITTIHYLGKRGDVAMIYGNADQLLKDRNIIIDEVHKLEDIAKIIIPLAHSVRKVSSSSSNIDRYKLDNTCPKRRKKGTSCYQCEIVYGDECNYLDEDNKKVAPARKWEQGYTGNIKKFQDFKDNWLDKLVLKLMDAKDYKQVNESNLFEMLVKDDKESNLNIDYSKNIGFDWSGIETNKKHLPITSNYRYHKSRKEDKEQHRLNWEFGQKDILTYFNLLMQDSIGLTYFIHSGVLKTKKGAIQLTRKQTKAIDELNKFSSKEDIFNIVDKIELEQIGINTQSHTEMLIKEIKKTFKKPHKFACGVPHLKLIHLLAYAQIFETNNNVVMFSATPDRTDDIIKATLGRMGRDVKKEYRAIELKKPPFFKFNPEILIRKKKLTTTGIKEACQILIDKREDIKMLIVVPNLQKAKDMKSSLINTTHKLKNRVEITLQSTTQKENGSYSLSGNYKDNMRNTSIVNITITYPDNPFATGTDQNYFNIIIIDPLNFIPAHAVYILNSDENRDKEVKRSLYSKLDQVIGRLMRSLEVLQGKTQIDNKPFVIVLHNVPESMTGYKPSFDLLAYPDKPNQIDTWLGTDIDSKKTPKADKEETKEQKKEREEKRKQNQNLNEGVRLAEAILKSLDRKKLTDYTELDKIKKEKEALKVQNLNLLTKKERSNIDIEKVKIEREKQRQVKKKKEEEKLNKKIDKLKKKIKELVKNNDKITWRKIYRKLHLDRVNKQDRKKQNMIDNLKIYYDNQ
jgi:hypothetical protein